MANRREIAASPSRTPRSERGSASRSIAFERNPTAPARTARRPSASSWASASTTTRIEGSCSWRRRVASIPSIPGIMWSITTTSGRWKMASSTASRPSTASARTVMPAPRSVSLIERRAMHRHRRRSFAGRHPGDCLGRGWAFMTGEAGRDTWSGVGPRRASPADLHPGGGAKAALGARGGRVHAVHPFRMRRRRRLCGSLVPWNCRAGWRRRGCGAGSSRDLD